MKTMIGIASTMGVGVLIVSAGAAPALGAAPGLAASASASEVDSVLVFPDRARVTRILRVPCEGGSARATFTRLQVTLDSRTLRGDAREAADVVGVSSEVANEETAPDLRSQELSEALDKVRLDMAHIQARKQVLTAEREDVESFAGVFGAVTSEEMRNPRPPTAAWGKSLEALAARRAALDAERRKLGAELRGLRLQETKLARQLTALGNAGTRAVRNVTVTIGCRSLSEVTALLSYVVPGASWQPEYDVDFTPRARGKAGPGTTRLTVGALVQQTTGEDWTNARLLLSTARPKLGTDAPKPEALYVSGREQARQKVLVQAEESREHLEVGNMYPQNISGPSAAIDDKGNAFVLTLPHRVTVLADGRAVWAPVDVVEAPGTAKLVATPKLDEHVYQVVALKNPAAYPLLEGRLRAYRAGSYVGDALLKYRGVGEPMEVSLGIDDELKVERKVLDERSRDPSLLSGTKHLVTATRVQLTNRAATSETVELRENLPVAQIDDVKVELSTKQTTAGYALDAARGFLTWSVPLKSGEKKQLDLAFVIHLPDAWVVNGR